MSIDQQFPPPPPGQPGYAPPAPPQQRSFSGLAITGFILAFLIAPLGFVLSLIAVFTTGAAKARGRGLAIAGVVVSLIVMVGVGSIVYAVSQSTVADPGCVSGKEAILNSPKEPDAKSLQGMIDDLNAAAAKAKHDDVRNAMTALAGDYKSLLDGIKSGKMPDGIIEKVTADGQKIDDLCTIGGAK
jgi:phosphotransferase system  glucose/maltose/N-acetylglucosamine-specific IIC component